MSGLYDWLVAGRDDFDTHVFACAIAIAAEEERPLTLGLGLSGDALLALLLERFPHALSLACTENGSVEQALEEDSLRELLIEHGTRGSETELWLAHVVARRSLCPNHLWQDLGLTGRPDLSRLMKTHFGPLAARNDRDMKWKKFFYRQLCQREGVPICKAPACDVCDDLAYCFGAEAGQPLLGMRG